MTADRAPDQGAEEAAGFSPADVFTALRREGTPDALDDAGRLTDADRRTAADVLFGEFDYGAGMLPEERRAVLDRIAAALAAERRRVVEPFETLAAEWDANCTDCRQGIPDDHSRIRDALAEVDGRLGSEEHAPLRLRNRAAALRGAANATSADLSDEQPRSGTRTPPND